MRCWLHHCAYRSEKQVQNDRKFITLNEKTWCPVHLKIRWAQGNLSQCFQAKIDWIKTQFPIETTFPWDIKKFLGAMTLSSDSLTWQMLRNLFLMETDHLLAEARSELMKQEYKVESLNTCISELQQQTYAQRSEVEAVHLGCAEYQGEQVRLQEESVMKAKALRDTQVGSMHEMWGLKESSGIASWRIICAKNWEKVMTRYRDSLHRYKSLQEKANCMNDSREFQDIESKNSGIFVTFPVSQQSFQVLDPCWAATNACHLIHGIYLNHKETFLAIHVQCSIHRRHLMKE